MRERRARSVNWKPVIAAPHGYAIGLALGIVLERDLIVAAARSKFQVTETSRGLGGAKYCVKDPPLALGEDTFDQRQVVAQLSAPTKMLGAEPAVAR